MTYSRKLNTSDLEQFSGSKLFFSLHASWSFEQSMGIKQIEFLKILLSLEAGCSLAL